MARQVDETRVVIDPDLPFVSVVVPTYNDARRLRTCLQALEQQTYPRSRYEVIVVDNGSDQPVELVVAAFPQARLAFEPRRGSYAARNRGITLARGTVIAFTDSDCIPVPEWLAQGVRALLDAPGRGLVGGRIEQVCARPDRPTLVDRYAMLMTRRQRHHVEVDHFGETANVFTSTEVLERVGPFDAGLKARGDVVWGRRVHAAGYQVIYSELACVRHPTPSLRELCTKVIRQTGGTYDVGRDPAIAAFNETGSGSLDRGQLTRIRRETRSWRPRDRLGVLAVWLLALLLARLELTRLRLHGRTWR
jgi:glycosyltransferase involved in cell wall biosynthesis